jgi:hypothetical protein
VLTTRSTERVSSFKDRPWTNRWTNEEERTMDEIADLADRSRAMSEFEFAIEWGSLTAAEQDAFMDLVKQRTEHGKEVLEALEEETRILRLLFCHQQGAITALEFVRRVRGAVPSPLAQQPE